jgi:predicted dehydrogenase
MSDRWRVGILGAGMMAQGFDEPGAPRILSMAHAFHRSANFTVGGFFDRVTDRAAGAEARWGCGPSPRDRVGWLDAGWDVVYIATPDEAHSTDLADVLERRPRAILIEKPVAIEPDDAERLLSRARQVGVPVMVNYPRRHHTAVRRVGTAVAAGRFARPDALVLVASGSPAHNLPHATDLFHTIWGGDWAVERGGGSDGGACLRCQRGDAAFPLLVYTRPDGDYLWEMHVYTPDGKFELSGSPEVLTMSTTRPHPEFPSYRVLTPEFTGGMEDEPLLPRTVEALRSLISERAAAEASERELASQRFTSSVLRCLSRRDEDKES